MRRDYSAYLEDITEAAGAAREFVAGMDKDDLANDRRTRDAVVRNLEIYRRGSEEAACSDEARPPFQSHARTRICVICAICG